VTASTSPDFAWGTLKGYISAATKSLDVMIYQITGPAIADEIVALHAKGEKSTDVIT